MKFARGKRIALGWLALTAPVPLPFNEVLEWPVFIAYAALVVLFLRRAARDPEQWLPAWAMNVIGLAYLPFFYIDLTRLGGGRLVGPVLHLGLFALVVKLFSLRREGDKWQAVIGIFFLFLAAMGTSVHPSIMLYLAGFVAVSLGLLARFAWYHVLGQYGNDEAGFGKVPLRGFLTFSTAGALLLAIPFFALLPRVRSPYIVGRGANFGAEIEAAGFTDDVTLDSIGQIRNSRDVALRLQWQQGTAPQDPENLRFKAATYDLFANASWRRSPPAGPLDRGRGLRYTLRDNPPTRWATIWLRPLRSTSLPLPVETAVVEPGVLSLKLDQGGAVLLPHPILDTLQYRVGLARQPVLLGEPPPAEGGSTLDTAAVTPRMRNLAAQVMGQGSAAERVVRLENHLVQKFEYTTTLLGAGQNGNPLDTFLFETRRGHCELFASSMVLLLRSQGVPARLVTGFLGGEFNPFEGYVAVRDSNAHAWVEAYVGPGPNEGWRIYDPTPPSGRPSADEGGFWRLGQQAYDFMLFRWDRYVLTFGVGDQAEILRRLYFAWSSLRNLFSSEKKAEPTNPTAEPAVLPTPQQSSAEALTTASPLALAGAVVFLLGTIALILWLVLRRRPLTPAAAYLRLRQRMARGGIPLPGSLPPLAVRQLAKDRYPNAAAPAARIIDFYVRATYAGEPLQETEQEDLRTALKEAEAGLRKAG